MQFERYAVPGSEGSISINLDPNLDIGNGSYQVLYWFGIRTTEPGAGMTLEAYATDRLGFESQNGHQTPLNGSASGSIQGMFVFDYAGLESNNAGRSFHMELGVFSPGGAVEYDYRIFLQGPVAG
jgi:hypothetical protein